MVVMSAKVRNWLTLPIWFGLMATGNIGVLWLGTILWFIVCAELTQQTVVGEIAHIYGGGAAGNGELNQTMLIGMIDSE